jgi:TusA-related sulfurtransferase
LGKDTQHNLYLRGTIIPFSLLKASRTFKMINPGEILEVLCSDPEVHQDLCKVLPAASYDLISMEALEDDQVSYRLRLVKKKLEDQTKETGINDLFS